MRRRHLALFAVMVTGLFILAACADPQQPTATNVPVNPTASTGQPTAEPTPSGGETPAPGGTPTAPPAAGDPAAGQQVFNNASPVCSGCHSTGSDRVIGPGLAGVGERAATRVQGLTADEYIRQSIREPSAYVVEGFPAAMPPFTSLSETDVNNLIAYLKTLQ